MYPRLSRVLLGTLLLMTLAMSTGQAQTSRQTIAKFGASHVTGFSLPADRPTTATLAQQAGVHYAREDFAWSGMEPSPGVYEWSTTDDSVAVNARHNLTTVADLAYTPVFYSPYPQGNAGYSGSLYPPTSQAGLNAWSAFVTATVTRYKSQIKYWTIWPNVDDREFYWPADPNNKHVPEYLAVLQRAYTAIKTVDPSAVVITAAMDTVFLEAMLDLGGASAFDAVGVHNYGNSQVPLQAIPEASYIQIGLQPLRDVLNRRANGKTLWIDETAWLDAGPGAISADTHAAYTIRSLLMQDAVPYVDTVLWTDLIDPPGGGYGMLLHSDLSKKLAYSAYQSMTTALNNASFLRQVPPPATARQVADDFETNRPYILYKDPAIGGAYSRTSTVAHTGSFSGKLDYDFRTTVAGTISYAPPTQYIPISGAPSRIRIWAKGTGGPAPVLLVNFQDANNKYFGAVMGFVSGTDWTEYVLPLDAPPGTTHLLQSDPDTSFQYPLTFTGFTVASWALSTHAGNGTIYVDDIQFDSGPSVYQYQYGNGSGEVRALWTLGPTVVVPIATNDPSATVRDWQNNVSTVSANGGVVNVSAGPHPVFVTFAHPTPGGPAVCSPSRPNVQVTTQRVGPGRVQATIKVTGTNTRISEIDFGPARNGTIDMPGNFTGSPGNRQVTLPDGATEISFFVQRSGGSGVTVPFTVFDGCPTPWKSFVGFGSGV